jgi:hypothetical protein
VTFLIYITTAVIILWTTGSQKWFLPKAGWYDEFFYIGFGDYYFSEPDFHRNYYKASRLPWIACQSLVRTLFDGITADLVIGYVGVILLSLAAFLLARNFMPKIPASFLATIFALLPVNHGSGGWNYHNTLAGPLCLLGFWSITRPVCGVTGWLMAGGIWGSLIHTNITYINFLLAVPLLLSFQKNKTEYLLMLIGGLIATAAWGFLAVAAGRDFDFWRAQFSLAKEFVFDPTKQANWYHPLSLNMFVELPYLCFPSITFLSCLLSVLTKNTNPFPFRMFHPSMFLLWICWHLSGQTALDWEYFAYPLQQSAFLGILSLYPQNTRGEQIRNQPFISAVAYLSIVLFALFLTKSALPNLGQNFKVNLLMLSIVPLVLNIPIRSLFLISLLSAFILFFAAVREPYGKKSVSAEVNFQKISFIYELAAKTRDELKMGDKTVLWYDEAEDPKSEIIYDSTKKLGASYAPSFACLGFGFFGRPPATAIEQLKWDNDYIQKFETNQRRILLLTNEPEKAARFLSHLKKSLPQACFYAVEKVEGYGLKTVVYKIAQNGHN